MSEQATLTRGWSIEGFRRFWAKPDPALIPRIREINTDDIVGYWPKPIGKVQGGTPYIAVIEAIFRVCPDLCITAEDYARSGNLHFVRWAGAGSGPDGRFEFGGIDRIRTLADGRVCENYVCSDSDFFGRVAACLRSDG